MIGGLPCKTSNTIMRVHVHGRRGSWSRSQGRRDVRGLRLGKGGGIWEERLELDKSGPVLTSTRRAAFMHLQLQSRDCPLPWWTSI